VLLDPVAELLCLIQADPDRVIAGVDKDVFVARAPGRLDVMGGIADYMGSLVCEMPLAVASAVAVQRRDDRQLRISTYNAAAAHGRHNVELSLDDFYGSASLLPFAEIARLFTGDRHWAAYVAGAYVVLSKHRKLTRRATGANIACYSNVPLGGGVSSSAALEVAALSALTAAYHLILEPMEIAVMAQKVEQLIVRTPVGVMDQATSTLGEKGKLLLVNCQPHSVEGLIDLPKGVEIVGIVSNVKHKTYEEDYRDTRVAAFMAQAMIAKAYRDFGAKTDPTRGYLANVKPEMYLRYFRRMLPRVMSGKFFTDHYGKTIDWVTTVEEQKQYKVRLAADYHVLECARVRKFVEALGQGDEESLQRAGRLMVSNHASYSRRLKLGSPQADLLVRLVMREGVRNGFYGAKITGGASGGTVAVMCRGTDDVRERLGRICAEYKNQTGLEAGLLVGSSDGAAKTGAQRMSAAKVVGG